MSSRPEWQLRSLRRIQLRIMLLLIAAYILTIAVGWLFYIVAKQPISGGLIAVPILIVSIFGVNMAYFRGVDDGQTHPKPKDTPEDI
jgi:hypothetical protein